MFTVVADEAIRAQAGLHFRVSERTFPLSAVEARHVHALARPELRLRRDVFSPEWRVVQHAPVAECDAPMHDEPFAARHHIAGQISTHVRDTPKNSCNELTRSTR